MYTTYRYIYLICIYPYYIKKTLTLVNNQQININTLEIQLEDLILLVFCVLVWKIIVNTNISGYLIIIEF
jgi:hypothetical protein